MSHNRSSEESAKPPRPERPDWNQARPAIPSSLRRANTSSLPRSHRVTSLVDLLPPSDGEEENDPHLNRSQSAEQRMCSTGRDSQPNLRAVDSLPSLGAGLGISMIQPQSTMDEWLEREKNHTRSLKSRNSRDLTAQPRGPRQYISRRSSIDPEMVPPPLASRREQPTTPGGRPRALGTPVAKLEDVDKQPEQLIDEILDDLYRNQAKSLIKTYDEVDANDETASIRDSHAKTLVSLAESTTPTRREGVSTARPSSLHSPRLTHSLSQPSHSVPTPSRYSDPFHPSPLRVSRTQLPSPPRITVNSDDLAPTDYKLFSIQPEQYIINSGKLPKHKPPSAFGYRVYSKPGTVDSHIVRIQHERSDHTPRPRLYFFNDERESILQSVLAIRRECKSHKDCLECFHQGFAYFENKAMPTNIPPEERAKIMAGNRSLRTIKTELENLLENGLISEEAYSSIEELLPSEGFKNTNRSAVPAAASTAPTNSFQNLTVNDAPPAYQTPAGSAPPPARQNSAPPTRPEIVRAIALYPYSEPQDCTFVVGDEIAVYEYMNSDWWMGRNVRTGKEGVFPVNYVQVKGGSPSPYQNEKQGYNSYQQQQQPQQWNQQQGPSPPGPSQPYDSNAPSAEHKEPGKGQEMGKKFGKKLGNAAIFGAGATIGSNIVNSIF